MRRHGAALIEEFIEGSEVTVLVAEDPDDPARPKTYVPIQYRFPEGETFKHRRMKWVEYETRWRPSRSRTPSSMLACATPRHASSCGLNGASFGRCDFRVTHDGVPFMLEINPNCGCTTAARCCSGGSSGLTYSMFTVYS
jgi:D-alanine-D-alanine ligase